MLTSLRHLHNQQRLSGVVVDEAHLCKEWIDFRGVYAQLFRFRKDFPGVPFHAFTATATSDTRDVILRYSLGMRKTDTFIDVRSSYRPNLHMSVVSNKKTNTDDHFTVISGMLETNGFVGACGIIYTVYNKEECETLTTALISRGYKVSMYHGGLNEEQQRATQSAWMTGTTMIMVATQAFGMGIDKANIRYVILNTIPTSIESMFQQFGRAGRDGSPAKCILMFGIETHEALRVGGECPQSLAPTFQPKMFQIIVRSVMPS